VSDSATHAPALRSVLDFAGARGNEAPPNGEKDDNNGVEFGGRMSAVAPIGHGHISLQFQLFLKCA
jgi:hypothetical protein